MNLPTPIAIYITADKRGDAEVLAECFTEDAVVRDEGKTIESLTAIKLWKAETRKEYQHTVELLASAQKDGKIIVTNRNGLTKPHVMRFKMSRKPKTHY